MAQYVSGQSKSSNPPLRKVESIIELGNQEARSNIPVHLRVQVTYVDAEWQMLFVQDDTGSIFATLEHGSPDVKVGSILDLSGVTHAGAIAPVIAQTKVKILKPSVLKEPALIDLPSLQTGFSDGKYVMTRGVLRPGPFLWDHIALLLADGSTNVPIIMPAGDKATIDKLIGALVTVRGVNGVRVDDANRRLGAQLFVSNTADIQPVDSNWRGHAGLPVRPIAGLDKLNLNTRFLSPVHVKGFVGWKGDNDVFVVDGTSGVYVHSPTDLKINKGAAVDIVGFPVRQSDSILLNDAQVLSDGAATIKAAPPVTRSVEYLLTKGHDGDSVRVQGRLISQEIKNKEYLFTVSDEGILFAIRAPAETATQLVTIAPGSLLQCEGVLRILGRRAGNGRAFELLADSPSRIEVKTSHAINLRLLLAIAIPCGIAVILLWVVQLKRALRSKTVQIRQQLANEIQLENRYRRLFERNLAAVFSRLPSGEITDCNLAFAQLLGFSSPAEVVGKSYWDFRVEENQTAGSSTPDQRAEYSRETSLRRTDGTVVHLLEQVTTVGAGADAHYETTALDVTQAQNDKAELQQARDAAQWEAERDALTGLPNRRLFAQLLEEHTKRAAENHDALAVLFIDLDGFKTVNDTLGHYLGDALLKAVGIRLFSSMSEGDILCRIGGDEFAVLLVRPENVTAPQQFAELVLNILRPSFDIRGQEITIGASIGISAFPDPAPDATTLLQQADSAMYAAKQAGKNQFAVYTHAIGAAIQEKNLILSELKKALARDEIVLHYQPEFDASSGQLMRFEALARWTNPTLGNVSPGKFIHIAEESGFIRELGAYLLEKSCHDAARWQQKTGIEIPVAVNVSTLQLRLDSFVDDVFGALRRSGLKPHLLELEMTESVMVDDPQRIHNVLSRLHAAGISLALDDFGTGYSCLSILRDLQFDRLKVDRSFLKQADLDRGTAALINAVISVAHALEMIVVIEGIETAKELDFVKRLGADEVQGFFLGRPTADPNAVIEKQRSAPVASAEPAKVVGIVESRPLRREAGRYYKA